MSPIEDNPLSALTMSYKINMISYSSGFFSGIEQDYDGGFRLIPIVY